MTMSTPSALGRRDLSGPEKVAALLLGMGKPLATRLLKHFDPTELKMVTRAAATLGAVSIETLEDLVEELAGEFTKELDLQGTASEIEHLLGTVLPSDQVAEIMADVLGNSNSSIWVRLSGLPEKDMAAYVTKEHPQTGALILSRLTPEAAAKTLAVLPRDLRNTLTRRMLTQRAVNEPTIRILENKLRDDLLINVSRDKEGSTQTRVADILNRMDPEQAEDMLTSIAETKPADAAVIRSKMFSFGDLVALSAKARSVLLEKVPAEQITMALREADEALKEAVLSAMGARSRRLVENELKTGSAPPKEIAAARKVICATVLDLIALGEIEPPDLSAADGQG
ncbi:FliG C-terminal domain-containing protein [Lichenifustis flavocetrariae]|uniref:Flagellar motor switch protein FliG n=1 Tax=Lichenifustis flavocetrariae TaxID=2949735 RepID=A0AA42CH99_9HYPH|nr:FliG C-terminal domain-containing protein [Lichenifustis flavocetrariae]MCW6507353.1 flagellar motor switch protein FliG [Lichenifustis flavocetrariae]